MDSLVPKARYYPVVTVCCVCHKTKNHRGEWIDKEPVISRDVIISHGYCPACRDKAIEEIRRLHTTEERKVV